MVKKLYNIWILKNTEEAANPNANPLVAHLPERFTTGATFQKNNSKLFAPAVTFSINDNDNKFLEHLKQGFRRTTSWNKYKSEITTQPKSNNLDYMIDPIFRNINTLFVLSFKNVDDDPARNCFDKY